MPEVTMHEGDYASKGLAGTALGTGIGGLALGLMNGGLNLLGGRSNSSCGSCSENQWVNRYELNMVEQLNAKDSQIALLEAEKHTDSKIVEVYTAMQNMFNNLQSQFNTQAQAQAVYNATANANIACIQTQVAQLQSLTKLIVPSSSICPAPMPALNSWTAPTTTTTTTPAA